MRHFFRALLIAIAAGAAVTGGRAGAQSSQRGQPKTAFSTADFGRLKWLEGYWAGTAPEENAIYQHFHFANDSTIEITNYNDPGFSHETGTARVYLSVGRVYHTFGPGRWGATHIDTAGVFFVPQVGARNSFSWRVRSPDEWTSTLRSGVSGHDRITVYDMKRVSR